MEEYWVRSERSDRHAAGYGGVRAHADRIAAGGSVVAAVVQEDDVGPPLDAYDLALHAVHGADVLGREHVLGPPDREDPPAAHQDDVVRVAGGDVVAARLDTPVIDISRTHLAPAEVLQLTLDVVARVTPHKAALGIYPVPAERTVIAEIDVDVVAALGTDGDIV